MAEYQGNVVLIGGFAGSGCSAATDLLSEFDGFQAFVELRLLVDPDGIMSLEDALVNSWTPYQSDMAIKRFRKLIVRLSNRYRYPYLGMDHTQSLGKQFVDVSNEYVNSLVCFCYRGMWMGIANPLFVLGQKANRVLGRDLFRFYKPIYVSFPRDRFVSITRKYLGDLIGLHINDDRVRNVIIDEGFASLNPTRVLDCFYSARMIVVHRDPRDTFANAQKYRFKFIPGDVDSFIKWYEYLQIRTEQASGNDDRIFRIQFEDLVLDSEATIDEVLSFLGAEESVHIRNRAFFVPDVSAKNIGLWKQHENQDEIERIYTRLTKYCYDRGTSGSL